MTSRAFGMVFACVTGAPLLSAALIILCRDTAAAVIACLALAAGGIIGAGAAILLIADCGVRSADSRKAEVDQETAAAIRDAVEQLSRTNTP